MVKPERVKVDAYIWGLTDNNKGKVTSSRPTNLNEAVCMAHKLINQKAQARDERILEGKKRKWENFQSGNSSAYDQVPQVWKGWAQVKILYGEECCHGCKCFAHSTCYDCGEQGASYEVELADRRVVSTDIVLKGCTLNLVNHVFEIDLMPIELGMFDDIIVESNKGVSRSKVISCIKAYAPVMRDFPKVFLEELPGLPSLRHIEFQIDLVLMVAPVAHAP
nr:hypothetical protein [Tanacetum cinerariifolium]